jgi:hypothetical protein
MARTRAAKAEAIEQLIVGYESSGMTRQEYSGMHGIPLSSFDYYRRRLREEQKLNIQGQQLVRVEVSQSRPGGEQERLAEGFTLKLGKERSIQSGWNFSEQGLMRLLRVVEAA